MHASLAPTHIHVQYMYIGAHATTALKGIHLGVYWNVKGAVQNELAYYWHHTHTHTAIESTICPIKMYLHVVHKLTHKGYYLWVASQVIPTFVVLV